MTETNLFMGTLSASVRMEGLPAARSIVALERTEDEVWRVCGSGKSDPDGTAALEIRGIPNSLIYAVAVDDWGIPFSPNLEVGYGDVIRPSHFVGWMYRVTQPGVLPPEEPEWWNSMVGVPRPIGTAMLQASRHYQPLAHGPVDIDWSNLPPAVVGYSDTLFVTAQSTTVTVPAAALAGDLLIASVMHRAELSVPPGWHLVESVSTSFSTKQWLSIFSKVAAPDDAGSSTLWEMADPGRLAVHVLATRTLGGTPNIVLIESEATERVNSFTVLLPAATAPEGNSLALGFAASRLALDGTDNSMTVSPGWIQTTPTNNADASNQVRMGAAYRNVADGELTSGFFELNITGTSENSTQAILLMLTS